MTYHKLLHVIHWEHNYPSDFALTASAEPILTVNPIVHIKTKAKMGLHLRWTLRIASKEEQILSFIAEQTSFSMMCLKERRQIYGITYVPHIIITELLQRRV